MKKFRIEEDVFELFPQLQIAVMHFNNIDNSDEGRMSFLEEAQIQLVEALKEYEALPPYIADYSQAMKQFKRKKGSLASIEAMAKRIKKGSQIGSVNPVVDLYNSVSLSHMITCGGENLDAIEGDMVLKFAKGDEDFVPLGERESKPPREGELIYADDKGAVVRSWLWREADRTKVTHETSKVLLYMELINDQRLDEFDEAMKALYKLITDELGGQGTLCILKRNKPECFIE